MREQPLYVTLVPRAWRAKKVVEIDQQKTRLTGTVMCLWNVLVPFRAISPVDGCGRIGFGLESSMRCDVVRLIQCPSFEKAVAQ